MEDDCASDDTGDWTEQSVTLAFDTDHYTYDPSGASSAAKRGGIAYTAGKLYKVTVTFADGTGTNDDMSFWFYDGASQVSANFDSSDGTVSCVFEAASTTASGQIAVQATSDFAGNIQITDFALYEVTPGCVAADSKAFDGWGKTGPSATYPDIWRVHSGSNYTKDGSFYSLKITGAATQAYQGVFWRNDSERAKQWHYDRFAGRTVTFGAWVWSATAGQHLFINDSTAEHLGYDASSTAHTGGSGWEWLEMTDTISASPSRFTCGLHIDASETAYMSQPMLVFGSSIGEGNYTRPQGEIVNCEAQILVGASGALAAADDATLNLEALTSGKIPKGCKAISVNTSVKNTSIADDEGVGWGLNSTEFYDLRNYPVVSNVYNNIAGRIRCDSNGDIYRKVTESGATISYAALYTLAVELR